MEGPPEPGGPESFRQGDVPVLQAGSTAYDRTRDAQRLHADVRRYVDRLSYTFNGRIEKNQDYELKLMITTYWEGQKEYENEADMFVESFARQGWDARKCAVAESGNITKLLSMITTFASDPRAKRSLLVWHYGGHASHDEQTQQVGPSSKGSGGVRMDLSLIKTTLMHIPLDVVVLLDCCELGLSGWQSALRDAQNHQNRRFEVMTSTSSGSYAAGPARSDSFSPNFLAEWELAVRQKGLATLGDLKRRLIGYRNLSKEPMDLQIFSNEMGPITLGPAQRRAPMAELEVIMDVRLDGELAFEQVSSWFQDAPWPVVSLTVHGARRSEVLNAETPRRKTSTVLQPVQADKTGLNTSDSQSHLPNRLTSQSIHFSAGTDHFATHWHSPESESTESVTPGGESEPSCPSGQQSTGQTTPSHQNQTTSPPIESTRLDFSSQYAPRFSQGSRVDMTLKPDLLTDCAQSRGQKNTAQLKSWTSGSGQAQGAATMDSASRHGSNTRKEAGPHLAIQSRHARELPLGRKLISKVARGLRTWAQKLDEIAESPPST